MLIVSMVLDFCRPKYDCNEKPVLFSQPGSVGDFCTMGRVPNKFHLSDPPPSFPPISVGGLAPLNSGTVRKGADPGLRLNQLLRVTEGDARGLALGVTLGVTDGVPQGVD